MRHGDISAGVPQTRATARAFCRALTITPTRGGQRNDATLTPVAPNTTGSGSFAFRADHGDLVLVAHRAESRRSCRRGDHGTHPRPLPSTAIFIGLTLSPTQLANLNASLSSTGRASVAVAETVDRVKVRQLLLAWMTSTSTCTRRRSRTARSREHSPASGPFLCGRRPARDRARRPARDGAGCVRDQHRRSARDAHPVRVLGHELASPSTTTTTVNAASTVDPSSRRSARKNPSASGGKYDAPRFWRRWVSCSSGSAPGRRLQARARAAARGTPPPLRPASTRAAARSRAAPGARAGRSPRRSRAACRQARRSSHRRRQERGASHRRACPGPARARAVEARRSRVRA